MLKKMFYSLHKNSVSTCSIYVGFFSIKWYQNYYAYLSIRWSRSLTNLTDFPNGVVFIWVPHHVEWWYLSCARVLLYGSMLSPFLTRFDALSKERLWHQNWREPNLTGLNLNSRDAKEHHLLRYVLSLKSTKSWNFHFLKEKLLPPWDISGLDYNRNRTHSCRE